MPTDPEQAKYEQAQIESIINSFLIQIAEGEIGELMTGMREKWNFRKLTALKKFTDEKIDKNMLDFKNAQQIHEKTRIFEEITDLITLRFKIQIVLNEIPASKRQSIPPRNLK
jgi:hypothetical protein